MGIDERSVQNAVKGSGKNGFTGSMKAPFEPGVVFEAGDIIVFPNEYNESNVFDMPVGNDGTTAECVIVTLKRGNTEQAVNFYPSMLAKTVFPAHKEGDDVIDDTPVQVSGTAAADYQACYGKFGDNGEVKYESDVAYAMSKFKGKSVEIGSVQQLETRVWKNGERTDQLRKTYLYEYNWVIHLRIVLKNNPKR